MRLRIAIVMAMMSAGCNTFLSADIVDRPDGKDASSDSSFDGGAEDGGGADATRDDGGPPDTGPPDTGTPDFGQTPSGCPRNVSGNLPWRDHIPSLAKVSEFPTRVGAVPAVPVAMAAREESLDDATRYEFASAFFTDHPANGRMATFLAHDVDVDFSDSSTYATFEPTLLNVRWTSLGVQSDDAEPERFAFFLVGERTDGCLDGDIHGWAGWFAPKGLGVETDEESSLLATDCGLLQPRVDIAGPYGPTGHVWIANGESSASESLAIAFRQPNGEPIEGPATGAWTDHVAASRRELVMTPSTSVDRWNAWFPLTPDPPEMIDFGTQGDVAVEWLFEQCHAVAGRDGASLALNPLDCSGERCESVSASRFPAGSSVGEVAIAAMPGGGFVIAYASAVTETEEIVFVRLFDDAFEPVDRPDGNDGIAVDFPGATIGDIAVAATLRSDGAVVVGTTYSVVDEPTTGQAVSVKLATVRLH